MPAAPAPFCQISVGDIAVTFVPDGYLTSSPTRSYPGSDDELWAAYGQHLDDDGFVVMSIGSLLIQTAGRVLLLDLGWGPSPRLLGEPSPGKPQGRIVGGALMDNLRKLGVEAEDVDAVLFSHLHRDHTGWILDPTPSPGGEDAVEAPSFPNAAHYLSKAEWDYWTEQSANGMGSAPSAAQLATLASRLSFVEDGEAVLPGVNVMETFGHTPGHVSFVISSGHERVIALGDAVHCPVEILEPELTFSADVDPKLAQRTRAYIAQALLEPDTVAAAPHFADLVFGRLLKGEARPSWHFPSSQLMTVAE